VEMKPVKRPEHVVRFIGDELKRRQLLPTTAVDLKPLLDAVPTGDQHVEVHDVVEVCEKAFGWIEPHGGARASTLTP
jgi:hypothetical protein